MKGKGGEVPREPWKTVKLGEIAECSLGKMLDKKKNHGTPRRYLANYNVRWGSFDLSEVLQMPFEDDELDKYSLRRGDIVMCEGGEIGRCALWNGPDGEMMIQKAIHRIRVDEAACNPAFLFYWFLNAGKDNYFHQFATGATILHLPRQNLVQMPISLPPLSVQRVIAGVLGGYDEMVENNRRRMMLLEKMARELYREMFVRRGKVYETKTLGEIGIRLESGSRPKGGVKNIQSGVPSVGAENVIGLGQYKFDSEKYIPKEFYDRMSRGKIQDRDILLYKDGAYIGRVSLFQDGFPHRDAAVNEHVFLIHTKEEMLQYYLFFTLAQERYFHVFQSLNENAAQPGLDQGILLGLEVEMPEREEIQRFDTLVAPFVSEIFNLALQTRKLCEVRDRLLPRLMSGKLSVEGVHIV